MAGIRRDLMLALRRIRRAPMFAAIAILTLAIGIGGTTAIFSAIHAVLMEPLPFPEPDRLALAYQVSDGDPGTFSPPNYLDVRAEATSLEDIGAFHTVSATLTGEGRPALRLPGLMATPSFFSVLGVRPLLGRTFLPEEGEPGNDDRVLLAEELWRTEFGADPTVLGRVIELSGESHQVVGVLPAELGHLLPDARIFVPRVFDEGDLVGQRGAQYLDAVARLAPGVTMAEANAELNAMAGRLEAEYPANNTGIGLTVRPLHDDLVREARPALLVLLGAVGIVLLIVCVNVANLFLVRTLDRTRELAVRTALGAGRARLAREILVESVLLGVAGGLAGLGLAFWGTDAIVAAQADQVPRLAGATVDGTVVAFAAITSILAGVLFGLLPAWRALRGRAAPATTLGGVRGGSEAPGTVRLRSALVAGQVALAVVLLAGAGLLARSFLNLASVDPGFRTENLLTFSVSLPDVDYPEPAQADLFFDRLIGDIEALPGVERVGGIFGLPLSGFNFVISVEELDGGPAYDDPGAYEIVHARIVTADYLETMDIPVVSGRGFTASDRAGSPPVAVLSRSAAEMLWPGEDALGHTLEVGTTMGLDRGPLGGEVVGVVEDVRHYGPGREAVPMLYVSHDQFPTGFLSLTVHTAAAPGSLVPVIRDRLAALDPRIPMYRIATGRDLLRDTVAQARFFSFLVGLFGAMALVLAGMGLYGMMAYTVGRRTREIGIRKALGADAPHVLRLLLGHAALVALAGVVIGLAGGLASGRLLDTMLFGLGPSDPLTLTAAAVILLTTAFLASWIPAQRAARIEPSVALLED